MINHQIPDYWIADDLSDNDLAMLHALELAAMVRLLEDLATSGESPVWN